MRAGASHAGLARARGAFTLVELLVVMAIIGLLAALLFPALSGARLKAQQATCLSHLRQLSQASALYASDHDRHAGYYPPGFTNGNWMGTLHDYAQAQPLLLCPSAPVREPAPKSGNAQGYADQAWVRWTSDGETRFCGSYGYNGWLYSDLKFSEPGDPKQHQLFTRESSLQKPALTPVFFDENWVDVWPEENDRPCPDLYAGQPYAASVDQMGRCTIARHGGRNASRAPRNLRPGQPLPGAINMALADGHTQLVKLEDLWSYYWHLDWQPPVARPTFPPAP